MKVKAEYKKIVDRFNKVMWIIGCEHLHLEMGELDDRPVYYDVQHGVTIGWMIDEAEYWLSCYYEPGHVRCDDKRDDPKMWRSETGYLKRLIATLKKYERNELVAYPDEKGKK